MSRFGNEIEQKEYIQDLQDVCDTVLTGAYKNHTPEWLAPTIRGVQGQQEPFALMLQRYPFSVRGLFGDLRHE